jgi:hypothetical protein
MRVHHTVFRVIKKCLDLEPIAVAIFSPLSEVALIGAIEAARAGLLLQSKTWLSSGGSELQ